MWNWKQTFGFESFGEAEFRQLAELISGKIGIPASWHENFNYGKYYCYDLPGSGEEHRLLWNEMPARLPIPEEAADPDLLDWKCIFWVEEGYESDELTAALLSIPGAKMLRPPPEPDDRDAVAPPENG